TMNTPTIVPSVQQQSIYPNTLAATNVYFALPAATVIGVGQNIDALQAAGQQPAQGISLDSLTITGPMNFGSHPNNANTGLNPGQAAVLQTQTPNLNTAKVGDGTLELGGNTSNIGQGTFSVNDGTIALNKT